MEFIIYLLGNLMLEFPTKVRDKEFILLVQNLSISKVKIK